VVVLLLLGASAPGERMVARLRLVLEVLVEKHAVACLRVCAGINPLCGMSLLVLLLHLMTGCCCMHQERRSLISALSVNLHVHSKFLPMISKRSTAWSASWWSTVQGR
jgi:hypothetical protein